MIQIVTGGHTFIWGDHRWSPSEEMALTLRYDDGNELGL